MPFEWKKFFGVVTQLPQVRRVMALTIAELEENPNFIRFVEKYQAMDPNMQCSICFIHKYAVAQKLTDWDKAPDHQCADNPLKKKP